MGLYGVAAIPGILNIGYKSGFEYWVTNAGNGTYFDGPSAGAGGTRKSNRTTLSGRSNRTSIVSMATGKTPVFADG
jgi:hypothetical protein